MQTTASTPSELQMLVLLPIQRQGEWLDTCMMVGGGHEIQLINSMNVSATWTTTSGSINSAGLFTAPGSAGSATVTATSGAIDPLDVSSACIRQAIGLSIEHGCAERVVQSPTVVALNIKHASNRDCVFGAEWRRPERIAPTIDRAAGKSRAVLAQWTSQRRQDGP